MPVLSETTNTVRSMTGVDMDRGAGPAETVQSGKINIKGARAVRCCPRVTGLAAEKAGLLSDRMDSLIGPCANTLSFHSQVTFMSYVVSFEQLRMADVDSVGGKTASLGEMISHLSGGGVRVPGGIATTAQAFRDFLKSTGLYQRIAGRLKTLDPD